ncbi:MAG: hypothetical protein IPK73_30805 [Candidatus Obscuribacter sp.]|nr:hypothetical protein [Candidatus Obscuribacter sp.]
MSDIIQFVEEPTTIQFLADDVTLVFSDVPGPQGPAGPAGGTAVTFTAGEAISAARVVMINGGLAYHFQPGTASHQGRAYGISTAAASSGASCSIQISGEMEHAAFTFAADKILYVYTNGVIVDSDPALAIMQVAGISSGSNKMRIDFSISILKA